MQQETSEKVTILHMPDFILGGILRNQLTELCAIQNNETTVLSVGPFITSLFLTEYCQKNLSSSMSS